RHSIKLWDAATGELSRVLVDEAAPSGDLDKYDDIGGLAVSPDGKILVVAVSSISSTSKLFLHMWDLTSGKHKRAIAVPRRWSEAEYGSLLFSPDSRCLAWAEPDGTIQLYDSATFDKVRSLGKPSKDGAARGLCFSEDGKTLAAVA